MFYVIMADLTGLIPGTFLIEALDDASTGEANPEVWDAVAKDASKAVDGILGGRYTVPFTNPIPAIVSQAAKIFAAEQLYTRRGKASKENPFFDQAEALRTKLAAIAKGDEPLSPALNRAKPSATVISEPSKTTAKQGGLSV